ncbi:nuclear transport factor 2 family protein [Mycobacterium sp. NPDC004974]
MTTTTDSVTAFCDATRTNDLDALVATLAPDAELVSPLSGRMVFRGHDDLRQLLGAVYGGLRDLTWDEVIGDGPTRVAISEGRVGGVTITDALVFELDGSGRIRRLRPHLRPWLATTVFAMRLGPKLVRHPGVLRRALRR